MKSRGRLFSKGGADVALSPTSSTLTYAMSSWTSKVNPILYASPLPTLLNGILLHTPSYDHARLTPTSTETREEARSPTPNKTEACKRRRKKKPGIGSRIGAPEPAPGIPGSTPTIPGPRRFASASPDNSRSPPGIPGIIPGATDLHAGNPQICPHFVDMP